MSTGYILGINGWFDRSHDASACIVKNGKVLAMAEEERFIRKKHAYDKTPVNSVLWCLYHLGLTLDDIEKVAVGWDYKKLYWLAKINEPRLDNLADVFFPKKYFEYNKTPRIYLVPHHLAHAASTFFLSGFSESSILIIDGQGENVSTTFAIGSGKSIKILWSLPVEYSLGYFYEAVSDFIGFRLNEAGKTMGLAPYGNSVKYNLPQIKITNNGFDIDLEIEKNNSSFDQQQAIISAWQNSFKKILGCSKNRIDFVFRNIYGDITKSISLNQEYKNFAASAQFTLESILQHCVKVLIKKTSIRNLCLAGGVALNCSANTKIKNINGIDKLFIPPFANDAGVSVGAALYVGGKREKKQFESAFVGPTFTNKEIELILKKLKINYQKFKNIEEVTARLIHRGKIVSWFQGQMEVGPRALGNRSILANPTLLDMHKKVNEAKNRELWRPLAPSILDEKGESYMNGYFYSPFMLHTFQVKDSVKRKVPAIVHIDGSTRPQSVRKNINPGFYKLIKFYEKLSGIPLILNTSFNGAKEPIVCTPLDAISSFYTNSTDYLVLSNYLIKK